MNAIIIPMSDNPHLICFEVLQKLSYKRAKYAKTYSKLTENVPK